jgi:hypothetical protein
MSAAAGYIRYIIVQADDGYGFEDLFAWFSEEFRCCCLLGPC